MRQLTKSNSALHRETQSSNLLPFYDRTKLSHRILIDVLARTAKPMPKHELQLDKAVPSPLQAPNLHMAVVSGC